MPKRFLNAFVLNLVITSLVLSSFVYGGAAQQARGQVARAAAVQLPKLVLVLTVDPCSGQSRTNVRDVS